MPQGDGSMLPLLDEAVLARLRVELEGNESIWRIFVQDFLAQLPARIRRVSQALTAGDDDDAMDAVLSLRTSTQMVGAERLSGLSRDLEHSLRNTHGADPFTILPRLAAANAEQLKRCADQTDYVLRRHLQGRPNGTP
ncbi:Hpt domain-containing protein [Arthrobacter sp. HMWF013]|nr:Hpt domain-containing protein [Arthrobacter sp. HMWF013]